MRLYHGSNVVVDRIDLTKSKPYKDFGQGFYLSDNEEQARNMARQKVLQTGFGTEVVNVYEFDERFLTEGELKVKHFEAYSEEWAKFVVRNRDRKSAQPLHDYDVVIGSIADDKVGVQIRLFIDQYIDVQTLIERLRYVKGITMQYYFGTERAVNMLRRIEE